MRCRWSLFWKRIQMNRSTSLRSRSEMMLSTVAPRRSRTEWPTTFRGVYRQVLGEEADTKSRIEEIGVKRHRCAADSGGSKEYANPVEGWNGGIQGPNGNESAGESIGLSRKHRGGFRLLRSVSCPDQRAGRIDDPNRERWRGLRKCRTRAAASRFAEVVGASVSSNDGSFWRFEGRYSRQLTNRLPLYRQFQEARTSIVAYSRHLTECSQCVQPIAVGSLGPSAPTELLLPLRPILRRYHVTVFVNSPRDPDARAQNLPATSVSTREGIERGLVFYAFSSSN
jgi:hypothetical protein